MSWRRVRRQKKKPPPGALTAAGGFTLPITPAHWRSTVYGATGVTFVSTEPPEPAEPPVIKDSGLAIEPIVAFRSYLVDIDPKITLYSHNGIQWPWREPLQASCSSNLFADHDAPSVGCKCGIYAWSNRPSVATSPPMVWGEVYLWGDVLICPRGYRAEFAYPKLLTMICPTTRMTLRIREELREAYGVPVSIQNPTNDLGS